MSTDQKAPVAVIGLGAIGSRITRRLLGSGRTVVVWNRTAEKMARLVALGAVAADSPAAAANRADIVITMLADEAALKAVTDGGTGLSAGVHAETTVIEMSTVGPAAVARLASALPEGTRLLDAPVLGSIAEAESGLLTIFVGGPAPLVERSAPLLSALGTIEHVGPLGAGAAAKLVANWALLGTVAVLGEALALAQGLALPAETAFNILASTPLAAQAQRRRAAIERGDYPARFSLSLARKDADLIAEAASNSSIDVRLATAAQTWLRDADEAGWGDRDYSAMLAHILAPDRRANE